jgi:hypothetical protein
MDIYAVFSATVFIWQNTNTMKIWTVIHKWETNAGTDPEEGASGTCPPLPLFANILKLTMTFLKLENNL